LSAGSSTHEEWDCASLELRRITANNFRKFRAPVTIDGLTDGLNIVVEPNETGKSTLLDAIRAAFFVPHRSSNQLTRSYQPFGSGRCQRHRLSDRSKFCPSHGRVSKRRTSGVEYYTCNLPKGIGD
jgi:hypothetical protein